MFVFFLQSGQKKVKRLTTNIVHLIGTTSLYPLNSDNIDSISLDDLTKAIKRYTLLLVDNALSIESNVIKEVIRNVCTLKRYAQCLGDGMQTLLFRLIEFNMSSCIPIEMWIMLSGQLKDYLIKQKVINTTITTDEEQQQLSDLTFKYLFWPTVTCAESVIIVFVYFQTHTHLHNVCHL